MDLLPADKESSMTSTSATPSSMPPVTAAATAAQVRKVQSLKARLAPFTGNGAFKPVEGVK
jgi:hypothetical protein